MSASSRRALALSASACAVVLALAGCSSGTLDAHAGNSVPSSAASSAAATSSSTPSTSTSSAAVTGSSSPSSTAGDAAASGSAGPSSGTTTSAPHTGWLTDDISGLPADPVLVFGGEPVTFTVTLRNGSDSTYRDISPLVSIGHCSCSTTGAAMAPAGTLAELGPSTGTWRAVDYIAEGTGMDFLFAPVQQPPVRLAPGDVASFTFKLAFSAIADQPSREHAGKTSIDVTIVTVPSRTVIGRQLVAPIAVAMPAS